MSLELNGAPHEDIVPVPPQVEKCPECGGALFMQVNEWETVSGKPTEGGISIDCENEPDIDDPDFWDKCHRSYQSDWMPVFDRVLEWARRHVRVREEARR